MWNANFVIDVTPEDAVFYSILISSNARLYRIFKPRSLYLYIYICITEDGWKTGAG